MLTKEKLTQLRCVAKNSRSSYLEANQARELIVDSTQFSARFKDIGERLLFGRTVTQIQTESLRRRAADFLSATRGLWLLATEV
jgi:hypothetical protein